MQMKYVVITLEIIVLKCNKCDICMALHLICLMDILNEIITPYIVIWF